VANYNVDIEVAVKGQAKVKSLQRELTALQRAVNELRKPIDATPGATKRKQELQLAKDLLNVEKAIKRERSARTAELVKEARLITLQRKEEDRIAAQRQRGLTQYNPFPNVAAGVSMGIGPEQDLKKLRRRAEIFDRIAKNRAQNLAREKQFKKLALDSGRTIAQNTGEHRAAGRAIEKKSDAQRKLNRLFQDANKIRASFKEDRMMRGQQRNQKIGGALSSGLIGGGFPLLFGQGGSAAAGGALGGLAGGAIGGGFGFALSIIGTAIGQAAQESEDFDRTLNQLNATLDLSNTSSVTTASSIKSLAEELNITKEEVVELISSFSGFGDANIREELARVFGPVGGEQTFRSIVKARLGEKEALEAIDSVSKIITLEKAKELQNTLRTNGALAASLALQEAILDTSKNITIEGEKTVTFADRFQSLMARIGTMAAARSNVVLEGPVTPEEIAQERSEQVAPVDQGVLDRALTKYENYLIEMEKLDKKYSRGGSGSAGAKSDPTINLEKRLNILNKQIASEQKVIGLSSEGVGIVRRKLAFEKRIAQIRETGKAERQKLKDQEDISLSKAIERNGVSLATLQFERDSVVAIERAVTASQRLVEPVEQTLNALKDRNAFEREYGELIMSGSTPAAAKQVVEAKKQIKEIDELVEKQLRSNEIQINILRIIVAQAEGTDAHAKAQEALNDALERQNEITEKGKKAKGEVKGKKTPAERIADEMKRLKGELNNLLDPVNQIIGAANAIGDAFSESFKGVISGSMTAQEALANLFQRTADHFLDMTAQIIAAAIKAQAIKFVAQIIGSVASAGVSAGASAGPGAIDPGVAIQDGGTFNLPGEIIQQGGPAPGSSVFSPDFVAAEGAYLPGGFKAFNQGGMVSQPTLGLVGEGGEPEYIIPQSKMRESMARYSRGSRGGGVIPSDGGSSASGDGGVAVAAPIDVRYTVERINSVDYVTADQFQSGMQSAAAQGAQRGEQNTLKRLQMSGSTRRRLGM